MWRCVMALCLVKIILLKPEFRDIAFSLYVGLPAIGAYTTLLGLVFLEYSLMGWAFFKGGAS